MYTEFKNLPSTETPLSAEILNAMQKGLMELAFPIGSTYVTPTETNPAEILGFGTWERFKKIPLGLDETDPDMDTIGKTGGEKKHSLTEAQGPRHIHRPSTDSSKAFFASKHGWGSGGERMLIGSGEGYVIDQMAASGEGEPFNVMNPYEIVGYMWIRRA